MISLKEYIKNDSIIDESLIEESFISNIFSFFGKVKNFVNKFKKAKTKIDSVAASTKGTYKSVGKDGIKAFVGDISYLIANDDKVKMKWTKGIYKTFANLKDKEKTEIIQNLYNDNGSNYKDIYDIIVMLNDRLMKNYKWPKIDQKLYNNDNNEPEDTLNYDLFVDTLQTIAVQLKKEGK